jgi:gentisate 1,2-dioxygenase
MATDEANIGVEPLEKINQEVRDRSLMPGWAPRPGGPSMWAEPRPDLLPAHWTYAEARDLLTRSAPLLSMEQTERRNVIMVNPSEGNHYPTLLTEVLAYQMILPGEHARTHRHSPHAGRLVIEADAGTYTVVDGAKVTMHPGDVVLTPGWSWHGHGHDGDTPAYWLDFLDVPLVQLLHPMFFEPFPDGFQAADADIPTPTALIFAWADTEARLDAEPAPADDGHGRRVELGSPALPTIGLYMERLDAGSKTKQLRTTANRVFCVVDGEGSTQVGDVRYPWSKGDVVAVPAWTYSAHETAGGATLFEMTDEPLMRHCQYLRQELAV